MNDYHMTTLANDIVAARRVEADRTRLARSAQARTATPRSSQRTRQPRRMSHAFGRLLGRIALY